MSLDPDLRTEDGAVTTPVTGVSAVDAVLESIAVLGDQPLAAHAEAFAEAHETLRRALDDVEAPDAEPA